MHRGEEEEGEKIGSVSFCRSAATKAISSPPSFRSPSPSGRRANAENVG